MYFCMIPAACQTAASRDLQAPICFPMMKNTISSLQIICAGYLLGLHLLSKLNREASAAPTLPLPLVGLDSELLPLVSTTAVSFLFVNVGLSQSTYVFSFYSQCFAHLDSHLTDSFFLGLIALC